MKCQRCTRLSGVMKAIMEIIARTYKINEEYLNKLEMPLRLVFWMGATWAHRFFFIFMFGCCCSSRCRTCLLKIERFVLQTFDVHINCGSIKKGRERIEVTQTLNSIILLRSHWIVLAFCCADIVVVKLFAIDDFHIYKNVTKHLVFYFNASAFWCNIQTKNKIVCMFFYVTLYYEA